jgi:hypothetical protein
MNNKLAIMITNVLFILGILFWGISIMWEEKSTLGLGFFLFPFIVLFFALILLAEIPLYSMFLMFYIKVSENYSKIMKWLLFLICNILIFEIINIFINLILWRIPYGIEQQLPRTFMWIGIIYTLICYLFNHSIEPNN